MHYLNSLNRATNVAKLLLMLSLLLASTGCSILADNRVWHETGPYVPELSVLDETMREFMASRNISAGSLAVTYRGRLVFARAYTWSSPDVPPTEPDSLFRIASISKPITAAAIMRLVQEQKLSLDDRVFDILPCSPPEGQTADPNLHKVTIRHLLQHLGGWDRGIAFDPMFIDKRVSKALDHPLPISQADIITYMNAQPLQHAPGTKYAYSNYGYCLLGRVIEKKTGTTYEDYVKQTVLSPLGIKSMQTGGSNRDDRVPGEVTYDSKSAYGSFNLKNMDSHGGWLASAPELVKFATAFDDPNTCPILSPASIETMFALPENIPSDQYKPGDRYYACGWSVRDYGKGSRNTWHGGSLPGTHTFMARWRDGIDCVVLFNERTSDSGQIDPVLRKAFKTISNWPTDQSH
jgi:CubicO group peptidase (beta-lactamase class C family)